MVLVKRGALWWTIRGGAVQRLLNKNLKILFNLIYIQKFIRILEHNLNGFLKETAQLHNLTFDS